MKRIRILDDATINTIAAGEVVESPASVLKELIDNAIDSRADEIHVEYVAGGLKLLRVSDNGMGMDSENLLLCTKRHATSKVETIDDVTTVETMGFRGEALASIGAVSKLRITSCSGEDAFELSLCGGIHDEVVCTTRSQGTTVEVADLFYNVPARRKFQKSPPASAADVIKTFIQLALAHPAISFRLSTTGKSQMVLQKGDVQKRIRDALGTDFTKGGNTVSASFGNIAIEGFVAAPSQSKLTRAGQYVLVNGRPIKSAPISFAVKDGYGTRLEEKKHPPFVLALTLPPKHVDVNVHPQKKEVRFKDEAAVKEAIRKAVSTSFFKDMPKETPRVFSDFTFDTPSPFSFKEEPAVQEMVQPVLTSETAFTIVGKWKHYVFIDGNTFTADIPLKKEGLLIVNMQAVSRRLFFDALQEGKCELQQYHTPITVPVDATEEECKAILQVGIEARPFGAGVVAIEAARKELHQGSIPKFFEEALQMLRENRNLDKKMKSRLQLLALNSMKERWDHRTEAEARVAIASVIHSKEPLLCPKGEPLFRQYDEAALEKGRL